MKEMLRIFKYVWPQWPRLAVIVPAAILIAVLFSLSLVTVVPFLKVMMGEEGLHGWVDRKICGWRYGLDLYVPETTDFTERGSQEIAYYLLVIGVKEDGAAETAGITREDRIVGAGSILRDKDGQMPTRAKLLQELASASGEGTIGVQLMQSNNEGLLEETHLRLNTGTKPAYVDWAQAAVAFIPREETKASKQRAVAYIILVMVVVTFIRCVATFYQKYLAGKVVQIATARLREDAFAHTMELPVGFFAAEGTSDTISRLIGDILGAGSGVKIVLGKALREPLKALGTLVCAMMISFKLTLIFLACAPATIGLGVVLGRKIKKATTKSLRSSAGMLGRLEGAITALRVVKVYNQQEHEHSAYHGVNRKYLKQVLRIAKIDSATQPIMEMLGMLAGSAALLVGVHWVTNANMQASSFFGLLLFLGTTAESVRKSSDISKKVQKADAAAKRVFAVIDQPAELERPGAVELPPLREKIEFRDVVFTYPGNDRPTLNRVNLTVEAGRNIALVGPNGAGKTTLVNLIPRFYNVDSGSVLIDGWDIRDCTLRSLRNQVGMVTQDVVTFNDTIAANIAYGKPAASREEIIAAAKRSFAHEFIEPLPDGYDTVIGEQGAGLSGGQLQRIVIARAVLKNPPILIFDEATSQIDANSEAKIHQAIEEIMQDRTSFIIAHRFSTVITADLIVVMDEGRIVACGQHDELMQTCSLYQSLYETQLVASK